MSNFKKVLTCKIISLIVAITFSVTSSVYGIDLSNKTQLRTHLLGNSEEGEERLRIALLYEILGQVVEADYDKDVSFYGKERRALLLEDGKILLKRELYRKYKSGNLEEEREALQVIIHELIEALLQVIKEKEPSRYASIKEIALNHLTRLYFKTNQGNTDYRDEILANDIWALILEHRLMGINPENIEDANLRAFLTKGYEIIDSRGDLFGEEFNSLYRSKETVMRDLRRGIRFDRVASGKEEFSDGKPGRLQKVLRRLSRIKKPTIKKGTDETPQGAPKFLSVSNGDEKTPQEALVFLSTFFDFLRRFSPKKSEVRDKPPYIPEYFYVPWGVVFPTNEWLGDVAFEELSSKIGVYIGTGGVQNFTFLAHSQVDLAVIVDVNPMVTEVLLPSLGLLIAKAENRLEFAALLEGLALTKESREEYEQIKNGRPYDFHGLCIKLQGQNHNDWKSAASRIQGTVEYLEHYLLPHVEPALRPSAKQFLTQIYGLEPHVEEDTIYKKRPRNYTEWLGTHVFLSKLLFSLWKWDWLGTEERFQRIKAMWQEGRILALTGDLAGMELKTIAQYLREEARSGVSIVYLSNVEEWLSNFNHGEAVAQQASQTLQRLYDNIEALPKTPDAVLIRSIAQSRIEPYASFQKPALLTILEEGLDARYKLWLLLQADWGIEHRIYASRKDSERYPPIEVLELLVKNIHANTTHYPESYEHKTNLVTVIKFLMKYEAEHRNTERGLDRLDRQDLKMLIEEANLPKILNFEFEILIYMLESVGAIKPTSAVEQKIPHEATQTGS